MHLVPLPLSDGGERGEGGGGGGRVAETGGDNKAAPSTWRIMGLSKLGQKYLNWSF